MTEIGRDVAFAMRQMRKAPGFWMTAVVTLALGIAAATAVFSLVDAVLLRPLPFPQSERLMSIVTLTQERGTSGSAATLESDTSYPNFFDWREKNTSFEALASFHGGPFSLASGNGPARRLAGMLVTADFLKVLRVEPSLGRGFWRSEESAGNRSVLISQGLWHSEFGGRADAIGSTLRLNDEAYTVVGVMPQGFSLPGYAETELWVTSSSVMEGKNPSGKQRGWNMLDVVGRLKPGVTVEQAQAEMASIQLGLAKQYPDDDKTETSVKVTPEYERVVGDVKRPLRILFGAVCALLLMACVNVAGLLLTRSAKRTPELALRSAIGATRMELIRQLLVEAMTLSAMGGLLGLGLASMALKAAPRFLPPDLPRVHEVTLDWQVMAFAIATSLVTGIVFGVLPAWRMSGQDPAHALRDSGRSTTSGEGQQRLHGALVVGETAIGLVLLVAAGLLIRSFDRLMSVDPGFVPHGMYTFRVAMPRSKFDDARTIQFVQQMQKRLADVPGVKASTYGLPIPMSGGDMHIGFAIDGRPVAPGDEPSARTSVVAANFFETMKMTLRKGRFFTATEDRENSAPVAIVNQAFADKFFPCEEALGKKIRSGISNSDPAPMSEIVGVVANVARGNLSEAPQPEYYIPFAQASFPGPSFAIRVDGDPRAYTDTVRKIAAEQDASLPVFSAKPYSEMVAATTAQQRFQTLLLSVFAAIALVLAAIGLYAVLSYMVGQRTTELGLRMALGAQRSDVLTMVLQRGLVLCGAGLGIGLLVSALLTRFMSTLLFGTKALDGVTFVGMTVLLFCVSTVACLVPSYRASQLNPNDTLRQQ